MAVGRQSARAVCCCDEDDVVGPEGQCVGASRVRGWNSGQTESK